MSEDRFTQTSNVIHVHANLVSRVWLLFLLVCPSVFGADFELLRYNNPGLTVDLGVGLWAWPLPMDYDGDGDYDLVISCADVPYNATVFFENPGGNVKMPVFRPAVRIGPPLRNAQVSYIHDKPRVLIPGREVAGFRIDNNPFLEAREIYPTTNVHDGKVRANQWKYCDYDGDDDVDIIVGVGDWSDYGWDNAFDNRGQWLRGPLHGWVYLMRNKSVSGEPGYSDPEKIVAGSEPIDVYGMPSPNIADFDGDGDLDLLCGEFIDGFTYFENVGTRKSPRYAAGRRLTHDGKPLRMDLCMITPTALDWDKDGDTDLIVGQEDGRVAFIENTGKIVDGLPQFLPPRFFQQQAEEVKFGALVTPYGCDWDGDGDQDLVCGNTAGHIGWIENLDGGDPPKWAAPKCLESDGNVIHIQAGADGSIQGPCEAKWGYTVLAVADWDNDGFLDLIANSIWGRVLWFRNVGSRTAPHMAAPRSLTVEWQGKPLKPAWTWWSPDNGELVTQWRTTPVVVDLTGDGLCDLVMLDHEGFLALYKRVDEDGELKLLPGRRIFEAEGVSAYDQKHTPLNESGGLLRLNARAAGRSGRRKLCFADWDGDGRLDMLVNSGNINFMRNVSGDSRTFIFRDMGPVGERILAGHTSSPTIVDWNKDGVPDLVVGGEDGRLYYLRNPRPAAHHPRVSAGGRS